MTKFFLKLNLDQMSNQINDLLDELSEKVVLMQKKLKKSDIKSKGKNDVLTTADLEIDRILIQELQNMYPHLQADFLTEESSSLLMVKNKDFSKFYHKEYLWIIDPIDGTANYASGSEEYAISVALSYQDRVILSAIARPGHKEIYFTNINQTASFLRKKDGWEQKDFLIQTLEVSKTTHKLDESRMAMEPTGRVGLRANALPVVEKLIQKVADPRNSGSGVTNMCLMAKGEIEACYNPGYPWDRAAASLIIKKAGGRSCQADGQMWSIWSKDVIFSNSLALETEILKLIN